MSWFKSVMSKAVEVGNNNNLTRTVKNYADSVVQQAGQAVAEGAKILQDHIVKREELLQFAESAITGLKINADLRR